MYKLLLFTCLLSSTFMVQACKIPVFRYALERWDVDAFEVVLVHQGSAFSDEEQAAVDLLTFHSYEEEGFINMTVRSLSKDELAESRVADYFDEVTLSDAPTLYLFHPIQNRLDGLIWQAPLRLQNVKKLLYSDVRKKIGDEICLGTTTVWLMLESGDNEKDTLAWKDLQEALKVLPSKLSIPEGVTRTDGTVTGGEGVWGPRDSHLYSDIPLEIKFSAVRMAASDDDVFVKTLLSMIEYPVEGEPMVFPLFGQARALDPLIGPEIGHLNIDSIGEYLCGSCSCEVKSQNPGIDVPMLRAWEQVLDGDPETIDYSLFKKAKKVALEQGEYQEKKSVGLYLILFVGLLIATGFFFKK